MTTLSPTAVTLVADTPQTITLTGQAEAVTIVNTGATDVVWFTTDGSTPAVSTTGSYAIPPTRSATVRVADVTAPSVKVVSHTTPVVSVEKSNAVRRCNCDSD